MQNWEYETSLSLLGEFAGESTTAGWDLIAFLRISVETGMKTRIKEKFTGVERVREKEAEIRLDEIVGIEEKSNISM